VERVEEVAEIALEPAKRVPSRRAARARSAAARRG
jgi:hypothetical protein